MGLGEFLARDTFGRTVSGGFDSAEIGGTWSLLGSSANYAVDGATGVLQVQPGRRYRAQLNDVSSANTDATGVIAVDGNVTGGGVYVSLLPRVMSDGSSYQATVRRYPSGNAYLSIRRAAASGAESVLGNASQRITGAGDQPIMVRAQAVGDSPTTIRARFWLEGDPEPTVWQVQVTSSTAGLQSGGGVGFDSYESSSASDPLSIALDDLAVSTP